MVTSSSWLLAVLAVASLGSASYQPPSGSSSLFLQRFRRSNEHNPPTQPPRGVGRVKIYEMHVESHVQHRFANTLITSRVANTDRNMSQEVIFSVVLPETAFISGFLMEVDGRVYKAYVKEKEEARLDYDRAIASGRSAAHVAVSARDSNIFTVSVNVEPKKKVTFNLTYDELLTRRLGTYNLAINLNPGQEVRNMTVDVYIKENRNLTILRVPELQSGNEVDADESTPANTLATIVQQSPTEAHVTFNPSPDEQKSLGRSHKSPPSNQQDLEHNTRNRKGLGGQFVVQYDVDRNMHAGEVLVDNGYFVHFFAPKDLLLLRKHVVFVLDVSGSMGGHKIVQLKEAMTAILDELNEGDFFNIIEFSSHSMVWDLRVTPAEIRFLRHNSRSLFELDVTSSNRVPAFLATPENIAKAKKYVNSMVANGGTNIYDSLKAASDIIHTGLKGLSDMSLEATIYPTIIFLSDGEPNVGITSLDVINKKMQDINKNPRAPIFSLAFGSDADFNFLKKLSLQNSGFARKIYEASDAAMQLRNFYRQIASPLLANVTFVYKQEQIVEGTTTATTFPSYLSGSEIVVAGKIRENHDDLSTNDVFEGQITGVSESGGWSVPTLSPNIILPDKVPFATSPPRTPTSSLERLWAYLTIQQLLEAEKASSSALRHGYGDNTQKNPKQEALELALRFSFVTPVTSLVVVKPDRSEEGGVEPADAVPVDRPGFRSSYHSANAQQSPSQPVSTASAVLRIPMADVMHDHSTLLTPSYDLRVSGLPGQAGLHGRRGSYGPPRRIGDRGTYGSPLVPKSSGPIRTLGQPSMPNVPFSGYNQDPHALINLNQLDWLPLVRNGTTINLPIGTYNLDTTNKNQTCLTTCQTSNGVRGRCHHLQQCSMIAFKYDVASYIPYFCPIDNYAGVCCPQIIEQLATGSSVSTPPENCSTINTQ